MMRQCCIGVVVFFFALFQTLDANVFDVTQWDLATGVLATFPGGDGVSSQTVQNPFLITHIAVDGQSSATTDYNFSWDSNYGDFLVQASHQAAAVDPTALRSVSQGVITISTNSDVLFSVDASYTYYLPVTIMGAAIGFQIFDTQDPKGIIFNDSRYVDTALTAPLGGTFGFQGQTVLAAGRSYRLGYTMLIDASGQSGAIATGDGYVNLTLQEVPEPTAFIPFALGALLLRKRHDSG